MVQTAYSLWNYLEAAAYANLHLAYHHLLFCLVCIASLGNHHLCTTHPYHPLIRTVDLSLVAIMVAYNIFLYLHFRLYVYPIFLAYYCSTTAFFLLARIHLRHTILSNAFHSMMHLSTCFAYLESYQLLLPALGLKEG